MAQSKWIVIGAVLILAAAPPAPAQVRGDIKGQAPQRPADVGPGGGGGSAIDAGLALRLGVSLLRAARAPHPAAISVPVYQLAPPAPAQVMKQRLAKAFYLPVNQLRVERGGISYVAPGAFLRVPLRPDQASSGQAIDFDALARVEAPDSHRAEAMARAAFDAAGYDLSSVQMEVRQTTFTAAFDDGQSAAVALSRPLETQVTFSFLVGGAPVIGPGALLEVSYGGDGSVTHMRAAGGAGKANGKATIDAASTARARVVKGAPATEKHELKLVYWAEPAPDATLAAAAVPFYADSPTAALAGPTRGAPDVEVNGRINLIPAAEDAHLLPTLSLKVAGAGARRLTASASVAGGRAPYTYIWSGSDPAAFKETGPQLEYRPRKREATATVDTLSVTVIDANGISDTSKATLKFAAPTAGGGAAPIPAIDVADGEPSYAIQSPREPQFGVPRQVFQQTMATPGAGGGVQKYAWLGAESWPGDFISPSPGAAGTAPAWITGDSDTRGINTAAMVLNNTDGIADGFAAAEPTATADAYATAIVRAPVNPATVMAGLVNYRQGPHPTAIKVDYSGAWGGPHSRLLWLLMHACDTLDVTDKTGRTPAERWGAAFGGLHMMTGWASPALVGNGAFEKAFAENLLGIRGAPKTVLQSWFDAAMIVGPSQGRPAAMGPIGTGGITDQGDFYLGKGAQGPTLRGADIKGFWYIHQ